MTYCPLHSESCIFLMFASFLSKISCHIVAFGSSKLLFSQFSYPRGERAPFKKLSWNWVFLVWLSYWAHHWMGSGFSYWSDVHRYHSHLWSHEIEMNCILPLNGMFSEWDFLKNTSKMPLLKAGEICLGMQKNKCPWRSPFNLWPRKSNYPRWNKICLEGALTYF